MIHFLQDTVDALKELSTFFTENTLRSRRNLRGEIEKRSVGISEVRVVIVCDSIEPDLNVIINATGSYLLGIYCIYCPFIHAGKVYAVFFVTEYPSKYFSG